MKILEQTKQILDVKSLLMGVRAGNKNRIETIEGFVKNPWGGHDFTELLAKSISHDLSMYMVVPDFSETIYAYQISLLGTTDPRYFTASKEDNNKIYRLRIGYTATGGIYTSRIRYEDNGAIAQTSLDSATTACTLTIIYHEMPK